MKNKVLACLMTGAVCLSMTAGSSLVWAGETESLEAVLDQSEAGEEYSQESFRASLVKMVDYMDGEKTAYEQAISDFILEQNKESLEPGDVTFCFNIIIGMKAGENEGDSQEFGDYWEYNFNLEDGTLKRLNCGEFVAAVDLTQSEDGSSCTITNSRIAAEGEAAQADIEAFCEEFDASMSDYEYAGESHQLQLLEAFVAYANTHPEVKGLENGEEKYTVEEAKEWIVDEYMNYFFGSDSGLTASDDTAGDDASASDEELKEKALQVVERMREVNAKLMGLFAIVQEKITGAVIENADKIDESVSAVDHLFVVAKEALESAGLDASKLVALQEQWELSKDYALEQISNIALAQAQTEAEAAGDGYDMDDLLNSLSTEDLVEFLEQTVNMYGSMANMAINSAAEALHLTGILKLLGINTNIAEENLAEMADMSLEVRLDAAAEKIEMIASIVEPIYDMVQSF